jgi:hypothetical protein
MRCSKSSSERFFCASVTFRRASAASRSALAWSYWFCHSGFHRHARDLPRRLGFHFHDVHRFHGAGRGDVEDDVAPLDGNGRDLDFVFRAARAPGQHGHGESDKRGMTCFHGQISLPNGFRDR